MKFIGSHRVDYRCKVRGLDGCIKYWLQKQSEEVVRYNSDRLFTRVRRMRAFQNLSLSGKRQNQYSGCDLKA
jgi:hypothetical protein